MIDEPLSILRRQLTGFVTGVWNPEDIVNIPGTRWVVVSAMRSGKHHGGLLAVDIDGSDHAVDIAWRPAAETGRASPALFDPHGIAIRRLAGGRYELLVIDHGGGEAIDRLVLTIDEGPPVIIAGDRIAKPPGTSGNAVAHLPDGSFVMTSMFDPRDNDKLTKFARSEVTGGLWRWTARQGWDRLGTLGLSGANGIAVTPDGSRIIVCEWAAKRIWRLTEDGRPDGCIETSFLPDNLRWAPNGRLTLAGQSARPDAVFGCEARGEPCPLAFQASTLDPVTLEIAQLVKASHDDAMAIGFGGATGALQVDDSLWISSFTGKRIAKFSLPI